MLVIILRKMRIEKKYLKITNKNNENKNWKKIKNNKNDSDDNNSITAVRSFSKNLRQPSGETEPSFPTLRPTRRFSPDGNYEAVNIYRVARYIPPYGIFMHNHTYIRYL